MSDQKAYTVRCAGKAIKTFSSEARAEEFITSIKEEPELFLSVQAWDPGVFYDYVAFNDLDEE